MRYRTLGRTGLRISEIGIGGAGLRCASTGYAVNMLNTALEMGVNYIDTAAAYGDSETKIGIALEGRRKDAIIATKLDAVTAEEGKKELDASLRRLRTDYVDGLSLHYVKSVEDLDRRMGPGGVFEVLEQARREGTARFLGVTGHRHDLLVEALKRGKFDMVLFIMNVAERDAMEELIPLALSMGVGMTVMKPVATGLLPYRLALRFLLSQPISAALPSATRIDWLKANIAVSDTELPLTEEEQTEAERLRRELSQVRCRICCRCEPCPQGIRIGTTLGTYRFYNDCRSMGQAVAREFPWGEWARDHFPKELETNTSAIERCNNCGECEPKCPYGLPIVRMLREMVPRLGELREMTSSW